MAVMRSFYSFKALRRYCGKNGYTYHSFLTFRGATVVRVWDSSELFKSKDMVGEFRIRCPLKDG